MSVQEVPRRDGSRKLLALDGGGIRGLISVEVLAAIEDQLRGDRGDDFRLSDEFDYVAGTSTGAVIATCVALGMTVEQIRSFYLDSGREMFDKASLLRRFRSKYEDDKLAAKLRQVIGEDTTLGSDRLRTLLLIVMRIEVRPLGVPARRVSANVRSQHEVLKLDAAADPHLLPGGAAPAVGVWIQFVKEQLTFTGEDSPLTRHGLTPSRLVGGTPDHR